LAANRNGGMLRLIASRHDDDDDDEHCKERSTIGYLSNSWASCLLSLSRLIISQTVMLVVL